VHDIQLNLYIGIMMFKDINHLKSGGKSHLDGSDVSLAKSKTGDDG
jgi:hypothetical protein